MTLLKHAFIYLFFISIAQAQATTVEAPYKAKLSTLEQKIEQLSIKYNVSSSIATKIIKCESQNKAHATGTLAVVGRDIGYWQINSYFHIDTAQKKGLNIYNPDDNLEYGFWLLSSQGVKPWLASRNCWLST